MIKKMNLQLFGRAQAYTNTADDKNYLGELFLVGANKTPFLNMIGGLEGRRAKLTGAPIFPTAQPWSLQSAGQPNISENASIASVVPFSYEREQESNTVQIFQNAVQASYFAQAAANQLTGLAIAGESNPVSDPLAFQKLAAMKQMAVNADYTFLNGVYQAAAATTTAARSRGIITACVGKNQVAAGSAALTKRMIKDLVKEMADNGADFQRVVLFANSHQIGVLSDIYGFAPESRTVGGVAITTIYTDFAQIDIVYDPHVPASTILIADMETVYPVFMPVPGKGLIYYKEEDQGASEGGFMYTHLGLDYGSTKDHGIITGLDDGE